MTRALGIGICLLGILLMLILGRIGEEVLGIALHLLGKSGYKADDLHFVAAFIVRNYRTNQGHFLLSLVPFLGVLAALPFLEGVIARWDTRFWYAFAGVWLAFATYLFVFAYGLLVTFTHLGVAADHEPTLVTHATLTLCALLVAALIGLCIRAKRLSRASK